MKTEIGIVNVRLDRITITGWIKLTAEQITDIMNELRWELEPDKKADWPWFRLNRNVGGDVYETVAVLVRNQFHNTWRLDTSNHLMDDEEKRSIERVVMLMAYRHVTRIDVAFDFINCKYPGMRHVVKKLGSSLTNYQQVKYLGKGGAIETIYAGKRRSLAMYRYYDKYVEQKRARKLIPEDIKDWERLEIQLRGKKTEDWLNEADKMLDGFKMPEINKIDDLNTKIKLTIYNEHPELFRQMDKKTQRKYKSMFRENKGYNSEYADAAKNVLKENMDNIQKQIDDFLLKVE